MPLLLDSLFCASTTRRAGERVKGWAEGWVGEVWARERASGEHRF
jgi:hypothetical protein